jgi:hypothetical protein
MKRKILLVLVMALFITTVQAQKKQQKKVTGFAITSQEKGGRSWKEVRLVDINSGQELQSIYKSNAEITALNARTGKPVAKKALSSNGQTSLKEVKIKKVVNLDMELDKASTSKTQVYTLDQVREMVPAIREKALTETRKVFMVRTGGTEIQTDKPFATNSAAMAFDKKHERLYYTPMGINQLRYIDLKSKTPKVYFFEDEEFGKVAGMHDAPNQITRMVIASDGNGYALSNDARHLIRFTTGRKPVITDLGTLTDDPANKVSVHRAGYGGDIIADAKENLYLITASRNVFLINIGSKVATYKGAIKGLPKGFSTNGAMVEEGSKVIVASSESTTGYFRFDLNTLEAEKVSSDGAVYNASDLANGNLAFAKKKKDRKEETEETQEEPVEAVANEEARPGPVENSIASNRISMYPNPAAGNSLVKLSFADQPLGKYQIQLIDIAGRTISTQEVNIQNQVQIVDLKLPDIARGSYLVKIVSEPNNVSVVNKLVIQ